MPPHNQAMPLHQALVRSLAEECGGPRVVAYDPDWRTFEAFSLSAHGTRLLDPLVATALKEALAETTERWAWDRGDRLGLRELGPHRYPFERVGVDLLHIYAVRRSSHGSRRDFLSNLEYALSLDHVCTIDLNVVAGLPIGLVGCEIDLHERRQAQRPEGARR